MHDFCIKSFYLYEICAVLFDNVLPFTIKHKQVMTLVMEGIHFHVSLHYRSKDMTLDLKNRSFGLLVRWDDFH